ncbi:DUF4123 domain-containing protein [Pseudomonas sp. NPDC089401]|uniref:DUF4123 domain-containing protein n=1 Tax=Pseudomonas sp. NPDC089401 TaxID=3364462 RepID=UPI00380F8AA4
MSGHNPWRWVAAQRALGREVVLLLDGEARTRNALMAALGSDRWSALYSQTPAGQLAGAGPVGFLVGDVELRLAEADLAAPQTHWGWLASLASGDWEGWVSHWRARLMVGQGLYRFHDNRVLGRALGALGPAALPAYLGPTISLCYWHLDAWQVVDNPAPGSYPVPSEPAWLRVPAPAAEVTLLVNADRYLVRHDYERYLALAGEQDHEVWLKRRLEQASAWGWDRSEQLAFLLLSSLRAPGFRVGEDWARWPEETPEAHFQRMRRIAPLEQGRT